jgi:hypothetical protein
MLERAWPALGTVALLALAAAGPTPRTGPAPPSRAAAACDPFSQSGGGATTFTFDIHSGIRQPFPDDISIASCSLRAAANGMATVNMRMVEWDPLTLAPDPQTIALRSAFCDPTDMNFFAVNAMPKFRFVPPIVVRSLTGVADPPRTQVAIEAQQAPYTGGGLNLVGSYEPEGDTGMPAASTYGPIPALSGSHPVMAYALCDGGGTLDELRIVQGVNRTDSEAPLGHAELLQRFRVPEAVELDWIELAMDELDPLVDAHEALVVSLVDGTGIPDPLPATLPEPLVQTSIRTLFYKEPGPRWVAALDLGHTVELIPGREYWLYLRNAQSYRYRTHVRTATETETFTNAIGVFHHRASAVDLWTVDPNQVLSFKLVGRATGSQLSVGPREGFHLRITPNPSRAAPEVVWSGATGPVRLEVFDARGRRVASGRGGAAGRWAVTAPAERPLAAGVYFVHARDGERARAVERVVIVR